MKSKLINLILASSMLISSSHDNTHYHIKETTINLHQKENSILKKYISKGYYSTYFTSLNELGSIFKKIGYHHTCKHIFQTENYIKIIDDQEDGDPDYIIGFHGKQYFLQNRIPKETQMKQRFNSQKTI